jgi:asparagine synthase (glutamine-hydrolysing)
MIDHSLSCSYEDCMQEKQGKMILKKSLAKKTNDDLVFQSKKGFTVPMDIWMRREIKKNVTETIMDMPPTLAVFFRRHQLEKLLKEHSEKKDHSGWFIWAIYSLINWSTVHRNKYKDTCA